MVKTLNNLVTTSLYTTDVPRRNRQPQKWQPLMLNLKGIQEAPTSVSERTKPKNRSKHKKTSFENLFVIST